MLRIVTDGAADLPTGWEQEFGIDVIPINVQFGEKTYLQFEELDNEGFYKLVDEFVKHLEGVRAKVKIILTLDTLEYARMSGRVGTLSAALASVLNVKPIAVLQDGLVNMVDKVRTRKAALERVLEMGREAFGDQPVYMGVVQARDPEAGRSLLEEAKKYFNFKEAVMADLSISLAANFGPGTVGLVLYPAEA